MTPVRYETIDEYVEQSDTKPAIDIAWARPADVRFIRFVTSIIDDAPKDRAALRVRYNKVQNETISELKLIEKREAASHRIERATPGRDLRTSSPYRLYPTSFIERLIEQSEHTYAIAAYLLATNSGARELPRTGRLMPQRPSFELKQVAGYANGRFIEAMGPDMHEHVTNETERALVEALSEGYLDADAIPTLERAVLESVRS